MAKTPSINPVANVNLSSVTRWLDSLFVIRFLALSRVVDLVAAAPVLQTTGAVPHLGVGRHHSRSPRVTRVPMCHLLAGLNPTFRNSRESREQVADLGNGVEPRLADLALTLGVVRLEPGGDLRFLGIAPVADVSEGACCFVHGQPDLRVDPFAQAGKVALDRDGAVLVGGHG
jgi:hypothetical protein